eukprot:9627360-Lingulodinium_polyedra.AAC.1
MCALNVAENATRRINTRPAMTLPAAPEAAERPPSASATPGARNSGVSHLSYVGKTSYASCWA